MGSDAKNEKVTMATLLGLEKAETEVCRLSAEARELIQPYVKEDDFLVRLISYLIDRKN